MKADYIRNTTKMVVLKDLVTNKTRSFIMVFVGSYDYLTRSRNMGRNSYLYREPDYDGMVLYYAINGTFINGWRYSNGKLVGYISPYIMNKVNLQSRLVVIKIVMMYIQQNIGRIATMNMSLLEVIWKLA